jgi:hypothetical protein
VDDQRSFILGASGVSGIDMTLTRMCSVITGRVTDADSNPICNADVEIWYPGVARFDTASTAEDWHGPGGIGFYRTLVPIGTWELTASKDGYGDPSPLMRTVEITSCGTLVSGQDFQLTASKYLYLPLVLKNS